MGLLTKCPFGFGLRRICGAWTSYFNPSLICRFAERIVCDRKYVDAESVPRVRESGRWCMATRHLSDLYRRNKDHFKPKWAFLLCRISASFEP